MTRLADIIALVLLHSLWQGTVIAAGLAVALAATSSARHRYAYACGALVATALAPLVTFVALFTREVPAVAAAAASTVSLSSSSAPSSGHPVHGSVVVAIAWALGAAIMAARLGVSLGRVELSLRRAARPLGEAWQARTREIATRLGIKRKVVIAESEAARVPSTFGWLRPLVLLPASAVSGLPPAVLDVIIAHELAHVGRLDYLVNILQSALEALLFFHPCVHWISRTARAEREHCCDDAVVGLTRDPIGYARALALVEGERSHEALSLAVTGGSLLARVRRLVLPVSRPRAPGVRFFGVALFAALTLLTIGALPVTASARGARLTVDHAAIAIPWLPRDVKRWAPEMEKAAARHKVDPELLAILTMVESAGDPNAKSPAGAIGLMQMMPGTARTIARERSIADFAPEKLREPAYNLDFAAFYLARALDESGGSVELAAVAYNGGLGAMRRWAASRTGISEETRQYRERVTRMWAERHAPVLTR